MTREFLKNHWSTVKVLLKGRFPELTDNDLAYVFGREDTVLERVTIRTGQSREQVEGYLRQEIDVT